MKTTVLRPWHEAAGARFAPFAGFDMPIQYPAGAVEEHRLCRRSAGLFDIDHMGQLIVSGRGAGSALSSVVSGAILDMKTGEARYSLLLNEKGGVIDDLFIYRLAAGEADIDGSLLGEDPWFVVVNAGNRETDLDWFRRHLPAGVRVEDVSERTCMIAVQGPRAMELLDRLAESGGPSSIPRANCRMVRLLGVTVRVGRTGYTGEDGAELYFPAAEAFNIWEGILSGAVPLGIEAGPVGLAARDSLRFEAGMPLHGHEISETITPLEALLGWSCDFTKDFTGKDALLKQKEAGLTRRLATVNVSGGVPREGYAVLDSEGTVIGRVAAGMFCPSVGSYSANCFVPPSYAITGTKLAVEIRGSAKDAVVVKRPLSLPVYRRKPAA
ncbi:MAG: glycine cleavage system aminomethyltransferase GcvT [Treponema sp.]|jgi:glycine cleavage system T protein|nr:glycine cleavage system aminomethyltransferase GcvT [Treponema sp.]